MRSAAVPRPGGSPTAPLDTLAGKSLPAGEWGRGDRRILAALVVFLVVTPRFGLPFGDAAVSVALPAAYLAAMLLILRRRLVVDRFRGELYALAATACLAVTAMISFRGGTFSPPSLMLLLTIHLPWIFKVANGWGREVVRYAGWIYVRVMTVVAGVGLVQFLSQLLGVWSYEDYVQTFLPREFTFPDYNTSIPLVFGSPIYKANAFVMLEPSFLSQYCALAVLIGLMLGVSAWRTLVLLGGLAAAVSGTGILLLAAGLLVTVLRAPRKLRPGHFGAAALAALLLFTTPTASLLLDRTDEVSQPGTSGYARFVQPYDEVVNGLAAVPSRYALGEGAGSAERVLPSNRDGIGYDVLYSTIPKLLFEYGLFAGGLFLLFLLVTMLVRPPWPVVPAALVVMTFALSGGLLQPQTAYLAWVFTGLGGAQAGRGAAPQAEPRSEESAIRLG